MFKDALLEDLLVSLAPATVRAGIQFRSGAGRGGLVHGGVGRLLGGHDRDYYLSDKNVPRSSLYNRYVTACQENSYLSKL